MFLFWDYHYNIFSKIQWANEDWVQGRIQDFVQGGADTQYNFRIFSSRVVIRANTQNVKTIYFSLYIENEMEVRRKLRFRA
jgi:hypothetical protein